MPKPTTSISAHKHTDKRANIPTEELRDFVAGDEQSPKTLRYPRDPSLDPQLVWQGKDEQDGEDLAVPAVPIYIQEKIHPQAIINDLLAQAAKPGSALREKAATYQLNLFADFNGGPEEFDQKVEFYAHEQNWANRLILGDSLLVMASLAEKEGLRGKVQMIYIDPPYGIKFGSNWQVSTRKRDVKDGKAEDATRQPEQIRAFRDTWKLGIHSYLAYLRDRLVVARELLTETGSVFVQIGDENVHLVRCVMDEVFGSENFVATIAFQKTSYATSETIPNITDYLLWYAKQKESVKIRKLFFTWMTESQGIDNDGDDGSVGSQRDEDAFQSRDLASAGAGASTFNFDFDGRLYHPGVNRHWKTSLEGLNRIKAASRLFAARNSLRYRRLLTDFPWTEYTNVWTDTVVGSFLEDKVYVVQTSPKVVARCLLMTTDPGDLCLDPTCGSGTTAYVAEQWGRRWITCDTSRVALALARTRLMSARYPYYLLADSAEGQQKEMEVSGKPSAFGGQPSAVGSQPSSTVYRPSSDIKKGFVYKRVPHVTLKSIANNDEIDAIHARWQAQLDPLRGQLNALLGQSWEEWQVPRDLETVADELARVAQNPGLVAQIRNPQSPIRNVHAQYWQARRDRQAEIDASIAKHADTETLYDQPYEDNKRLRVSGPFSVESLSPHRVLSTADENQDGTVTEREARQQQDFTAMILDNLRKAGVQNTRKAERLTFDRLDPYPGAWLHAAGEYTETSPLPKSGEGSGARVRRVAVSIGPEHDTVGPQQIKEAAKEAVQGVGFDLLIVCGFAFDPHVSEEVKRYGKLTVLPAKMNPDLAMGDELLKKTGAGNLFMVFGEPDVDIRRLPSPVGRGSGCAGDLFIVEIKGVDVYDPTTGQIRSASTDDIACWFIDTDYDGESFFVRHAYFTGADQPYDKLKRALRADIDEAAWSALYSTVSRPFARPASGKIAVKVINHYGDEVLKVFTM